VTEMWPLAFESQIDKNATIIPKYSAVDRRG
jgi:hypothetical protein